ncbi:Fic family protein [Quadrisphaera granulorum]|uniref:Fic family protein n=1 Tax=Quadrisphaera granulorum TaxID=317664 RepID=A0A316A5N2_9ACTN|nr:Fic family protein [Quadrisphaera granulorum]SZE97160.1 Fic family protein [Quadrisphaera granulorum]
MTSPSRMDPQGEPAPWPALTWEEQTWIPSSDRALRPGARTPPTSYRSAVPPFIHDRLPRPSPRVTELAAEAANELSRFDAELGARVSGFAPVLLRSEAASSSQIEDLTASARAIFSAELGIATGQNAELVAANTRALRAALELAESISTASILQMHAVLMASQPRHTPGSWRQEAVWIGTRSDSPQGATFIAPHHSRIRDLMEDLVTFASRGEVPALVSAAVTHAQFETIHPFTDGNGRTGRALVQSMLRHRGVTRNVAVPVSAGLLADVNGYHAALTAYREGDLDPIVVAVAEASLRAVSNARHLVDDIDRIKAAWSSTLTARRDSNAWALLDVIARQPVISAAAAAQEVGVQTPNIYPPLRTLVDAGILKSKREHRIGPFWRSDEVLAAIDAFAERAGRREIT